MGKKLKNKEKRMGTHIRFDDEEKYSMFIERKYDSHRIQKNKKIYDRSIKRTSIMEEMDC